MIAIQIKPIKLSPKKNGYGSITSYTINIGASEARDCGFIDSDGNVLPTEKIIDTDSKQIIIKLKEN